MKSLLSVLCLTVFMTLLVGGFEYAYAADSSTADVINHVVDKLSDGLAQVSTAMSSAAPKAWGLVIQGNFAEALVSVIVGSFFLLLAPAWFFIGWYFWPSIGDHPGPLFAHMIGIICFVVFLVTIGQNLAMVISPEAVTARDLLFNHIH